MDPLAILLVLLLVAALAAGSGAGTQRAGTRSMGTRGTVQGPVTLPPSPSRKPATGCNRCADGWICEQHPDQPWPHARTANPTDLCSGPGVPCPTCRACTCTTPCPHHGTRRTP